MKIVLDKDAFLPERAHETDAGYDLRTPVEVRVNADSQYCVDTGVHVQIPEGYVGFIKTKSGLMCRNSISTEGVIDSGYTGPIVVCIRNHQNGPVIFERGDKIAQLVVLPITTPNLEVVDSLDDTDRGSNGFGSTGK